MVRIEQDRRSIVKLVELAVLTAIVLVLQLGGFVLRLPFLATPVSLVLIPIVLGAILTGPIGGAWLGLVFGLETLFVCGVMGTDLFTATLFQAHPALTSVTCIGKGVLAGLVAGLCYHAFEKKNRYAAVFTAAAVAPVVNTGFFILCGLLMRDTIAQNFLEQGSTVIYFLVIGCAGFNFVFEFLVNMIFTPAIHRLILLLSKNKA